MSAGACVVVDHHLLISLCRITTSLHHQHRECTTLFRRCCCGFHQLPNCLHKSKSTEKCCPDKRYGVFLWCFNDDTELLSFDLPIEVSPFAAMLSCYQSGTELYQSSVQYVCVYVCAPLHQLHHLSGVPVTSGDIYCWRG